MEVREDMKEARLSGISDQQGQSCGKGPLICEGCGTVFDACECNMAYATINL